MVCATPFLCGSVLTTAVPHDAIVGSSFSRIPHSAGPTVIDGANQNARDCPEPISPSVRLTTDSVGFARDRRAPRAAAVGRGGRGGGRGGGGRRGCGLSRDWAWWCRGRTRWITGRRCRSGQTWPDDTATPKEAARASSRPSIPDLSARFPGGKLECWRTGSMGTVARGQPRATVSRRRGQAWRAARALGLLAGAIVGCSGSSPGGGGSIPPSTGTMCQQPPPSTADPAGRAGAGRRPGPP